MEEIKPIETIYNGYRFRSRLEARWAVFFDAARIDYRYEPEGFDLSGEYYLPDFYLPDYELYVEIKPFNRKIMKRVGDNNPVEKLCRKFRDCTDNAILLCYDDPATAVFKYLFAFDTCDSGGGSSEWNCMFYEVEPNKVRLITEPTRSDREIFPNWEFGYEKFIYTPGEVGGDDAWGKALSLTMHPLGAPGFENCYFLKKAQLSARQARFEHGEKPVSMGVF